MKLTEEIFKEVFKFLREHDCRIVDKDAMRNILKEVKDADVDEGWILRRLKEDNGNK